MKSILFVYFNFFLLQVSLKINCNMQIWGVLLLAGTHFGLMTN